MTYQEKLKALRLEKKLSAYRLSQLSGVSMSTIYYYEKGGAVTLDKVDKILRALGVTLVLGAEEGPP